MGTRWTTAGLRFGPLLIVAACGAMATGGPRAFNPKLAFGLAVPVVGLGAIACAVALDRDDLILRRRERGQPPPADRADSDWD